MRVQHHDVKIGQTLDYNAYITDSEAAIEQQGTLLARYQERDDFLILPRLIDGEDAIRHPVNLEPVLG